MSEFKSHFNPKINSERSFGFCFCVFFAIYAAWPLFHDSSLKIWPFFIIIILLIITIWKPGYLRIPNIIWFKLGVLLGKIVSPIAMGVLFFLAAVPTGCIMRIFGKDLLRQRFDKKIETYWIPCENKCDSMKNQF